MRIALLLIGLILLAGTGCQPASRFELLLTDTKKMEQAHVFFGKPDAQTPLAGGTVRYDWKMNKMEQIPGQWVEEVVAVRRDRDGYPENIIRRYFSPAHMEPRTCHLTLIATKAGQVVSSAWGGNSCGSLLSADRQNYETLTTGPSLQSLEEGMGSENSPWF